MRIHAVHTLYEERLARSTRPFLARGCKVQRCRQCMLRTHLCICEHRPLAKSNAAFLLVMFDDEILKPSNTGRLIADVFEDTFAYIWSRTEPNVEMLALLDDPQWQPYVVFPAEYAPEREAKTIELETGKRPLFIMLDGSWAEAKKMFRKSPYLDRFPLLSINPDKPSRYKMREASKENQLGTAEVAARIIDVFGEHHNAELLDLWFDVFRENYIAGKMNRLVPEESSLAVLEKFMSIDETSI
ncbi:tRNA-uridine aminocarboxypropyltransferase [Photobacterium aquimaris]|uniref:tRNA-uridine aminocarboxypropyltransferase n=1 Tax=Photobacterium aquimaris TaxID=512643 RepID=A0A2T3HVX7_9GAMM|nr:tRNA-uridine aminocarboxypropyltransferase [Photobacterium aquimaris]OBU20329.1 DTW domain-containing protein [Photobacterium aquimaris]PQJ41211.1 DTW domain-containing protein [Photobacterium aquimaris]PSU02858.1 DTW domain-containing protein [Photobacterium aquimaris]